MLTALISITIILFFIFLIITMMRHRDYYDPVVYDNDIDETVTTTTTTVTTTTVDETPVANTTHQTVGDLKRKKARNGQYYVMDPVDKDKVWLNDTDDLYQDGAGKIWKLT